jgi:hypothetical protein
MLYYATILKSFQGPFAAIYTGCGDTYNRTYLIIMDVFMKILEDIWDQKRPFSGCTLYGKAQQPLPPGLPFPPEEAEDRFLRLREGGIAIIRLVLAWETLEYAGPGLYDEAYLAYLRKILVAAAKAGIPVFIDPAQNQWSRWIGGDGFPPWALEQGDKGREGLQERYLDCMRHCFRRLKNCTALIGWGARAGDFSRPFMLRFAERMREAREGTRFFMAEDPRPPEEAQPRIGTGEDPAWAADVFHYYDGSAFPDYPITDYTN